jgi:hypothetical protein
MKTAGKERQRKEKRRGTERERYGEGEQTPLLASQQGGVAERSIKCRASDL